MCLVDDDEEVPDIFCNDERCLQVFHKACLVQVSMLCRLIQLSDVSMKSVRDYYCMCVSFLLCSGYVLVLRVA